MADVTDRNEQLQPIRQLTDRISSAKAQLDALYEERGDLFLATVEADPTMPVKAMADAAGGITGPAVSQQIDKARARRDARASSAPAASS